MESEDPLLGRVIGGKLKLLALLGSGAMGKVYRAHHEALDKTVAIKVLHQKEGAGSQLARRFKAEARAASRLDHPNSLRILDFGEDGPDGLLYIAMEFLDGEDLSNVLRREGRLDGPRAADIMAQVCAALSVAHQQGVVHRDMKPGNIMLLPRTSELGDVRDVVKVCDFGLAKVLDAPSEDASGAPLTKQGAILGTPAYMSPEQASGEKTDGATDIYSCGVILYCMLAGKPPFTAESATGLLMKHILEEPVPLASVVPEVDPRLAVIAHKAMAKKKEERFATARDMLNALREVVKADAVLPPLARSASERALAPAIAHPAVSSEEKSDPYAKTFVRTDEREAAALAVKSVRPMAAPIASSVAPSIAPAGGAKQSSVMVIVAIVGSVALFFAGVVATMLWPKDQDNVLTAQLPEEPAKPVIVAEKPVEMKPEPAMEMKPEPAIEPTIEPVMEPVPEKTPASKTKTPRKEKAPSKQPAEEPKPEVPVIAEQPKPAEEPKIEPKVEPVAEEPKLVEPPKVIEREKPKLEPRVQLPQHEAPKTADVDFVGLEVGGGVSTTRTMGALDKVKPMAKKCVETIALPEGKKRSGEIKVTGRIDAYGKLVDLKAGGGGNPKLDACVQMAVQSARLPKPDTGEARISFSIKFNLH
jgi:serine/threonine-protein kinase